MTQLDRIELKLDALLAKKKPVKRKSSEYPEWFEDIWSAYPKREGSNPKQKAWSSIKARKYDDELELMTAGVKRYADYCEVMVEDKRFVMQAARFFGTNKEYLNDWTIPKTTEAIPKRDEDLIAWSEGKGFRHPRVGESWDQYRRAVTELYRNV